VFPFGFNQHLQCRVLEIKNGTQIESYDPGLCFLNSLPDLVRKLFGIREENSSFRPYDQQTWQGFVLGMFFGVGAEDICAWFACKHVQPRVRDLIDGSEGESDVAAGRVSLFLSLRALRC